MARNAQALPHAPPATLAATFHMPISQMRKLRLRETKSSAQRHTECTWQSQDSNPGLADSAAHALATLRVPGYWRERILMCLQ